jgi:hypothetical protein
MAHSFERWDRGTHAKIIFVAVVLCSAVVLVFFSLGSSSYPRGKQVVRAKTSIDVSNTSINAVR